VTTPIKAAKVPRIRMTAAERREQLIGVARGLFAERGFEGSAIEEVAHRAAVSKPIVYEHFGGKEGLYTAVVDQEVDLLLSMMREALTAGTSRELLEQAAIALLDYIEQHPEGFRILVRDSPIGTSASFQSIIGDVATRVEGILMEAFTRRGLDPKTAPMYAQMLVGMVGTTGQWWLDIRRPDRHVVAAHLVNLAWNGLSGLEQEPELLTRG
jgi:AcrR family transcriptional regulator